MKKTIYLLVIAFFICLQTMAQNMPVPDPNSSNVLFLKFSSTLNSNNSYYESQIRISEVEAIRRPTYTYVKTIDGNIERLMQRFYVPNPEEFAYIDPATYNSVSLDLIQLATLLKFKSQEQKRAYLESFTEIYLIDYEQKYTRGGGNKVKILRVKPCNFWF